MQECKACIDREHLKICLKYADFPARSVNVRGSLRLSTLYASGVLRDEEPLAFGVSFHSKCKRVSFLHPLISIDGLVLWVSFASFRCKKKKGD